MKYHHIAMKQGVLQARRGTRRDKGRLCWMLYGDAEYKRMARSRYIVEAQNLVSLQCIGARPKKSLEAQYVFQGFYA